MYEIIDALLPITFVAPLFPDDWIVVVGVFNVFIRLGSVFNFIISPIIYSRYGLSTAFWLAALIGSTSILLVLIATKIEKQMKEEVESERPSSATLEGIEMTNCVDDVDSKEANLIKRDITILQTPKSVVDYVLSLPYFHFGLPFYLYMLSGSLLYGSIVPFWFIGSKYMQDNLHLSVYVADALMGIPDGMIIAVCLPLGLLVSRCGCSLRSQLACLSVSSIAMAASFLLLISVSIHAQKYQNYISYNHISTNFQNSTHSGLFNNTETAVTDNKSSFPDNTPAAVICMLTLGISFALGYSFFWGLVTKMIDTVSSYAFLFIHYIDLH